MTVGFEHRQRDCFLVGCALALGMANPISAQRTSSLHGLVRDSLDNPIPHATVVWGVARQVVSTTDSGSFALADIPTGKTRFTVRRLGYVPADFDLVLKPGVIKSVIIRLVASPSALPEVAVEARVGVDDDSYRIARFKATGFFDRKAHLPGYFISPDEVEKRRPTYISDLMYGVPGVAMVGRPHSSSLRYVSFSQRCRLQLYMDGHPAADGDDLAPGSDVMAIEVYTTLLAAAESFLPSPLKGYCGSIVVWTK